MDMWIPKLIIIFALRILYGQEDEYIKVNEEVSPRVFNGRLAEEGEFPYVVSIFRFNKFYCGGSMISGQTVLTAAHCVVKSMDPPTDQPFHPTIFKIGYGSLDLTKMRKMPVKKVIVKGNPLKADVAVLWTKVKLPGVLKTIPIPKQNAEFAGGTKIQLIGWGDINSEERSTLLRTTSSILKDDVEICLAKETSDVFKLNRLCGEKINGSGICQGDSGSPVVSIIHGKPVVVGVNSYLREKCDMVPSKHGMVFAKISVYTDWLFNISAGGKPDIV